MKIFYKYACAALILLLSSCGNNHSYWNALPKQSAAVVSIDLPKLANRAGIDDQKGKESLKHLQNMLKSGLEGSGPFVDRIFKDVSECGIDFREKVFVFSGEENAVLGLLAKVESRDKLEDLIHVFSKERLCQSVRETDGCYWTVLGKWLLAYSDKALLVLADNKWSDPSKLVRQASMWLRQEDGEGFSIHGDFKQLMSSQSDITCWTSLQLLPRKILTPLTMGVSAELDLRKVKAITSLNFESGMIYMDIDPLITDHIMQGLNAKKELGMKQIKGNHLDLFPSKTTFWTTAHLKGQEFYQFLREIPAVRKFFDYSDLPVTIDYGRIIEAIDGDVSFSITDPVKCEFIMYADVNQTDFLKVFTDLRPIIAKSNGSLYFEEKGTNQFCIATRDGTLMNLRPGIKMFWLGVQNDRFYFTNNEKLVNQKILGLSLRNKEWGKRVPGMNYFAITDWKGMKSFEYMLQKDVLKLLPKVVPENIDQVMIESTDGQHIRCTIELKNKQQNLIQLLLQM